MPATATVGVQVQGLKRLNGALKVLADNDAPIYREAISKGGVLFQDAANARNPFEPTRERGRAYTGKAEFVGLRGAGALTRALVRLHHPGSKPMEFGRTTYYAGFKNRKQKATGRAVKRKGQAARPFVFAAGESVMPRIVETMGAAIQAEFERLAGGPAEGVE